MTVNVEEGSGRRHRDKAQNKFYYIYNKKFNYIYNK